MNMLFNTTWVNEGLGRELLRYGIKFVGSKINVALVGEDFDLYVICFVIFYRVGLV